MGEYFILLCIFMLYLWIIFFFKQSRCQVILTLLSVTGSVTDNQSVGRACLYCCWSLPDVEKTELTTYREANWNRLLKTMKSVHSCISPICGEGRCHSLSCCGPLFNQSALDLRCHHSGCVTCCRVFGGLQCKHICITWIPLSIASVQTNNYPNRAEVLCHKLNIKAWFFHEKMSLSHNYQVTTNLKKLLICVSWMHFWVQRSKQTSPDRPLSGHFLQLVQRDTVVFPVCPEPAVEPPPGRRFTKLFPQEASRRDPDQKARPAELEPRPMLRRSSSTRASSEWLSSSRHL